MKQSYKLAAMLVFLSGGMALAQGSDESAERERLAELERQSHQWWLDQDTAALEQLMVDEYRFVAPNGALETKGVVIGSEPGAPRVLQVETLRMETEEVILRGNTAVVTGVLHMKATVFGRPAPDRLRVLSVFERSDATKEWRLVARSTTPVRAPPPGANARPQ